jgi:hypothetical protein
MNEALYGNLDSQVDLGRRAEVAYRTYMHSLLQHQVTACFNEFQSCNFDDTARLRMLKYRLDTLAALEANILADIQSGEMASQQLRGM